jgi:hypothetical protein
MNDSTPPSTQARIIVPGEPAMLATSTGVSKMPAPITMPTVIMVASKMLSVGAGASRAGRSRAAATAGS